MSTVRALYANKKKILIVEDEKIQHECIKKYLGEECYDLVFAEDGLSGFEKAKDLLPHLIIMDCIMPGMNGLELLKQLKKNQITSSVPVIMMSSNKINPGCPFLRKPFGKQELLDLLEKIL